MGISDFFAEMKDKASTALVEISGGGQLSVKAYSFNTRTAEVTMIRGGAIEKAVIMHMQSKGEATGAGDPVTAFVYQMEIFPVNPHCPMGHFNTEGSLKGPGPFNMNLDLFPAVSIDADLTAVRQTMDRVADKFGRDRDKLRQGLDVQYNMTHWDSPLAAMVGCKLMELNENELELFIDAYRTFFEAYIEVLKKRKDEPYTPANVRRKLERNGKWLEYVTLKDGAIKAAQAKGWPPELLIDQGFPPVAAF